MKKYSKYTQSIENFIKGLNNFENQCVIFLDTETTGLKGPKVEQLTQVAAVATEWFVDGFVILDTFNEKIELTPVTKERMEIELEDPWNVKNVLIFNHYSDWDGTYKPELEVIEDFFNWVADITGDRNTLIVIQNAGFDKSMIEGRSGIQITHDILDTKHLFQFQYLPLLQTLAETDEKYGEILKTVGTSKSKHDNGLPSSSLSNISNGFNLSTENNHDALRDCLLTMECLRLSYHELVSNRDINIEVHQQKCLSTKK